MKEYVDSVMLVFGFIWLVGGIAVICLWALVQLHDFLEGIYEDG